MKNKTKLCPRCKVGTLRFSKEEKLVSCTCGYTVDLETKSFTLKSKEGYANFS